jgi:Cu(I)/Ag(I) efflux system protein CusF
MRSVTLLCVTLVLAAEGSTLAFSQPSSAPPMHMGHADNPNSSPATHQATGVVKSVDAVTGTVTIAHDPIKSLEWPKMTMDFKLKDRAWLNRVKPGDKLQFTLLQSGPDYVITSIR